MTAAVRHRRRTKRRVYLHIAAWTAGVSASIVPHIPHGTEADLGANPPPPDSDYLDGDGMVVISENHCLLMPSGLHIKSIELYLRLFLEHARDNHGAQIPQDIEDFELISVANADVIRAIRSEGIKRIHLNVEQYLETMNRDEEDEATTLQRIGAFLTDVLPTSDQLRRDIEDAANLRARLTISCDGRSSGLEPDNLIPIADKIFKEDEDKIAIETSTGRKVRNGELILKSQVNVADFAKTVHHGDAWEAMREYFRELNQGGMLEE